MEITINKLEESLKEIPAGNMLNGIWYLLTSGTTKYYIQVFLPHDKKMVKDSVTILIVDLPNNKISNDCIPINTKVKVLRKQPKLIFEVP